VHEKKPTRRVGFFVAGEDTPGKMVAITASPAGATLVLSRP
jgi:hypothetical protein